MSFANSNINLTHEFVCSSESNITVTDSNDIGLKVYYYNECDDETSEEIKNTRGVVFDNEGNVVMRTFGYTPEYSATRDFDIIDKVLSEGINTSQLVYNESDNMFKFEESKGAIIFESEEGSLIRIFNYQDKWYVATHRKLDAYHSKWSSRVSFGEVFESAINYLYINNIDNFGDWVGEPSEEQEQSIMTRFFSKLDKTHQYTFLLRNTRDNRIVCKEPEHPTTYYVGSFWNSGNSFGFDAIPIRTPRRPLVKSTEELVKFVESSNPNKIQGVIIITTDNKIFKVMNDSYNELYGVRDNCPSVKFRYLQVRNNPALKEQLIRLYPNFSQTFTQYEQTLKTIAREIHNAYMARFVNKQYKKVSPDLYVVIKICHGQHIADRNVKITYQKVYDVLNNQSPVYLNRVIKTHLHQTSSISFGPSSPSPSS
jgi:hypothetical protein